MNNNCCYQCKDRKVKTISGKVVSCHKFCKKYQEYVNQKRIEKEKKIEEKKLDRDSYSMFDYMSLNKGTRVMERGKRQE